MMYMALEDIKEYFTTVLGFATTPYFITSYEKSVEWGYDVVTCKQVAAYLTEQEFKTMQSKVTSVLDTSEDTTIC